MFNRAIFVSALALFAGEVCAQSFQTDGTEGVQFFYSRDAEKISFSYLPPATKMFAGADGQMVLFPALFPRAVYFRVMAQAPDFVAAQFDGAFVAYSLNEFILALDSDYELFSASIVNGRLVLLARDADGDFVSLQTSHFSVFNQLGRRVAAEEITGEARNIAVLVDRSGSLAGEDSAITGALAGIAQTPIAQDYCGIIEFGGSVRTIVPQQRTRCVDAFARYNPSRANGATPLFRAMERAYREAETWTGISAQIIISDGLPSDQPSVVLRELSRQVPTFVLWVGNHSENHLSGFSAAHAISQSGDGSEISDFLRAVSFSVRAHQTFALRLGDGS